MVAIVYFRQRSLLYFPTHSAPIPRAGSMVGRRTDDRLLPGSAKPAHDLADDAREWRPGSGQGLCSAAHVRSRIPSMCWNIRDMVRAKGSPSLESINQAASSAYQLLRARHPNTPVCVLGESLGSGPACALAREKIAPDKIVLVVPFDTLADVAARHFPVSAGPAAASRLLGQRGIASGLRRAGGNFRRAETTRSSRSNMPGRWQGRFRARNSSKLRAGTMIGRKGPGEDQAMSAHYEREEKRCLSNTALQSGRRLDYRLASAKQQYVSGGPFTG